MADESTTAPGGRASPKPFSLFRSFVLWSLPGAVAITILTILVHWHYHVAGILERDAQTTMETIQGLADVEESGVGFEFSDIILGEYGMPEFFMHLATLPDVVWVRVFRRDRTVIWSNDPYVVGKRFDDNESLRAALGGDLVSLYSKISDHENEAYKFAAANVTELVEHYVPVWDARRESILGVVEVYRNPADVLGDITGAGRSVMVVHAWGAVFLYLMMLLIVCRVGAVFRARQRRLTEAEVATAVGDMAVGMAHIIRNPLASIRTSAELALEAPDPDTDGDTQRDIIAEVDRLAQTMRELILLARNEEDGHDRVHIADLVRNIVTRLGDAIADRGIAVSLDIREPLAQVVGDAPGLQTALYNVISGALHAMKHGGPLAISLTPAKGDDAIELTIADGEDGMPEDLIEQVIGSCQATRKRGFDPGLSLVRRVIERHGGSIVLSNPEGRAAISIYLPTGTQ